MNHDLAIRIKPRRLSGFWPIVNKLMTAFSFILLYVPIVMTLFYSFLPDGSEGGITLRHWLALAGNEKLADALGLSLSVSVAAASISAVVGGAAAIGIERGRIMAKNLTRSLTHAPFVMPEMVFGLGLLIWFVFLQVTLGWWSLVLAHVTFSVSYVVVTVTGRLKTLDPAIDDAARDLGASPFQVFWRVTLPLMWPGIAGGWLMAFALSFDDFLISFFTGGTETTLPMALYSYIKFGVDRQIFAMATLLFGVTFLLVLGSSKLVQIHDSQS